MSSYAEDDELYTACTTRQFRWITTIQNNLDYVFRNVPDVFVAGDLPIYTDKAKLSTRQAPDSYVVFGRPKGDRGGYKVWDEGGIFPQVIFEVWSPNNRVSLMQKKFEFYEKYGAEEYYIVYPDFPMHVDAWRREKGRLVEIEQVDGWVSPRLGIRFRVRPEELMIYRPDNTPFLSFLELTARLRELGVDPEAS